MEIEMNRQDDGVIVVRLIGRLDSLGADRIGARFTAAVASSAQCVAIDLSGLSFLASLGIRLFIASGRALGQRGGRMVIFGASELVAAVLDHVGIDQMIPIVGSEKEALDRLAG